MKFQFRAYIYNIIWVQDKYTDIYIYPMTFNVTRKTEIYSKTVIKKGKKTERQLAGWDYIYYNTLLIVIIVYIVDIYILHLKTVINRGFLSNDFECSLV